jgi:hypothetical protein
MTTAKTSNQAKAPKCAEFVNRVRAVFPDAKAIYVEEGDVKLGEPIPGPFASCFIVEGIEV